MKRTSVIVLSVVVLLVGAAAGFVAGDYFDLIFPQQQAPAFVATGQGSGQGGMIFQGEPGTVRRGQGFAGQAAGGMVFGEIQQIGDGVLVIKDADGLQQQVKVTDTTLIEKNASVDLADLAAGETVIVSGSKADDGAITARSIQVAPSGRMGLGQPPAAGTPAP